VQTEAGPTQVLFSQTQPAVGQVAAQSRGWLQPSPIFPQYEPPEKLQANFGVQLAPPPQIPGPPAPHT
jgi:hypothetical protein